MVVCPVSSRRLASAVRRACRASGAAPPYMPECTGPAIVRTVTSTTAGAPQAVVTVGSAELDVAGVGDDDHVAPRRGRRLPGRAASSPPVDMLLRALADDARPRAASRRDSSPSARSASRIATRLPLQSAAPRPYQRPSRSVSSQGGVLHRGRVPGWPTS